MRTRWLVLAGAILAINAPALDRVSFKLFDLGLLPGPRGIFPIFDPFTAAYLATAMIPLLMAFGWLRESPAARFLFVSAFVLLMVFWILAGAFGAWSSRATVYLYSGPAAAGLLNVLGQLAARLPGRVAAATCGLWLGVLLLSMSVSDWIAWGFQPWFLGTYAGLGGGALVAAGEWKGLCEPVPAKRPGGSVV